MLSKEFLTSISLESSLNVNLSKYKMDKFTDDDLELVIDDIFKLQKSCEIIIPNGVAYRIKSIDSVKLKIKKYKTNVRSAGLCFNDLISFRFLCNDFSELSVPDYFKVVDMSNGKANDDGYRAIHLYFKLSNRHYPIEIQIWRKSDENFINWSHKYCYKTVGNDIMKMLRAKYDSKEIMTESDFREGFERLNELYSSE